MFRNLLTAMALLTIGLLLTFCSDKEISCIIKGKVKGRASDTIFLSKGTEDFRFSHIIIPIKDSSFQYKLVIPQTEVYFLIFKDELEQGFMRPIFLFPENGEINCKLYPFDEYGKNQIEGGKLNKEYTDYSKMHEEIFKPKYQPLNDSSNALMMRNEYFSDEMIKIQKDLQNVKDDKARLLLFNKLEDIQSTGADLSLNGKAIKEKMDMIGEEMNRWRYDYIEKHPSYMTYYFIFQDLMSIKYNKINIDDIKRNNEIFSKKYPNHPYAKLIKEMLVSLENIKVGGKFIDFSAPDLNGKVFILSEVINGKVALIDLWSSWCGPCIMTSRSMIPVYNEFKDKGFTICGVASEYNNTNRMRNAVEREKFPWINLVELDHKNQVWEKYGIPHAGGGTFLVDKDGKILAISPTAEEVRNMLNEKLK
jgi:peroxiredoxin